MSKTKTIADMQTAYDARAIEPGWYARWEKAGLFTANANSPKPKFTMCFPPPNITGELHMGHALQTAIYDLIARYKRMAGYEVLFLPGYDHAGIATQNVIEKQLAREGKTKEELGREQFDGRVNAWYQEVGATIINQLRLLGASMDWSRLRFTMDERYVRSVKTAFVAFYDRGWIYRAPRIVNWCPHDQSAISDLEVKWEEHHDTLYFIRYPIEGGGESQRSAIPIAHRQDGGPTARRQEAAHRRRRGCRAGFRHRRAQGHTRPRPDGLRHRPASPSRDRQRHASRRAHERARPSI